MEDILSDARGLIRLYKLYECAQTQEGKTKRLQELKRMCLYFEEKWNQVYGVTYKTSTWLRILGRKVKNEQEIYKRTC